MSLPTQRHAPPGVGYVVGQAIIKEVGSSASPIYRLIDNSLLNYDLLAIKIGWQDGRGRKSHLLGFHGKAMSGKDGRTTDGYFFGLGLLAFDARRLTGTGRQEDVGDGESTIKRRFGIMAVGHNHRCSPPSRDEHYKSETTPGSLNLKGVFSGLAASAHVVTLSFFAGIEGQKTLCCA